MAKITFDIPDAVVDRVVDAIANKYQYERYAEISEVRGVEPMPKVQFIKKQLSTLFKSIVAQYESQKAVDDVAKEIRTKVEQEINIT